MKKVLLLLIIISVAGGFFVYHEVTQKAQISTTLSARSQQFIKSQKGANNEWDQADFTGPTGEDTRGKRIGKENCYSFVTPYRITSTRMEEDSQSNECFARFSFSMPSGWFLVYTETKPVSSWEDVSGVSFRRRKPEEYIEQLKTINGKKFLMFQKKDQIYEKNVFYYTPDYYLVFNFITKTNENLDAELEAILASLEIEK